MLGITPEQPDLCIKNSYLLITIATTQHQFEQYSLWIQQYFSGEYQLFSQILCVFSMYFLYLNPLHTKVLHQRTIHVIKQALPSYFIRERFHCTHTILITRDSGGMCIHSQNQAQLINLSNIEAAYIKTELPVVLVIVLCHSQHYTIMT